MSENTSEHLEGIIERVEQLSTTLLEVLHNERQALIARALPELQTLTDEKAELCGAMDAALADLGPTPLREQIAALPEARRTTLQLLHARLLESARSIQEWNAVNGKIVHRSQQSIRELMHLMSGTDTDALHSALYSAQGHSLTRSPGTAIAKA
jgi:flagellar biosynthesis/type III secretory pathway chaperone